MKIYLRSMSGRNAFMLAAYSVRRDASVIEVSFAIEVDITEIRACELGENLSALKDVALEVI